MRRRALVVEKPGTMGIVERPALEPGTGEVALCAQHVQQVDYKNVGQLRRFISDRGKIRSRPMTGACRRHQRQVAVATKRAREMALLPYLGPNDAPPSR